MPIGFCNFALFTTELASHRLLRIVVRFGNERMHYGDKGFP
jgi:hypothetical protein